MKFKKIISLMLSLVIFAGCISVSASDDYANRGYTAEYLINAADFYNPGVTKSDIIKGYPDGKLHEELNVTRAEALVMLKRAFKNLPELKGHNKRVAIPKDDFTDIPKWAEEELNDIFDLGIVAGTKKGTFSPDSNITKKQLEIFCKRMYALYGTNEKDDFYATVNKKSLETLVIHPGKRRNSVLGILQDKAETNVRKIIEEIIKKENKKGTPEQKIADMYKTILDKEGRKKVGLAPIKEYLDNINNSKNVDELSEALLKSTNDLYFSPFVDFGVTPDLKDSNKYIVNIASLYPSMNKDFYEDADEKMKQMYIEYIKEMFILSGEDEVKAKKDAILCFDFEKELAKKILSPEEYWNMEKTYNIYTMDELQQMFKNLDLRKIFKLCGFKETDTYLLSDVDAFKFLAEQYNNSKLDTLKAVAGYNMLLNFGSLLMDEYEELSTKFDNAYLGIKGERSPEEKAVINVRNLMPEYIGKIYSERYFDEESKTEVIKMVKDIISVYRERIDKNTWLSDGAKEKAKIKLDAMKIKMGYPDDFSTYLDNADIKSIEEGGSFFYNYMEIVRANVSYLVSTQNDKVDKTEWIMNPFEANACYSPTSNDITFPAAILQEPMYDKNASYEENLGGIGYVIAHEITHAFDNAGSQFDENGNAVDWWTKEDHKKFEELCKDVEDFYTGEEGVVGIPMNGTLTLGENIADLGSVSCITEIASKKKDIDFKTLYRQMAKVWLATTSRENAEYMSKIDVHSDPKVRVNRVLVNFEEFYKAFSITEKDGMFVPENERVKIW